MLSQLKIILIITILGTATCTIKPQKRVTNLEDNKTWIKMPRPSKDGNISLEKALSTRRSIRSYSNAPLSLTELSQLLWAAQGITNPSSGFRTAPSAGALYPLELYVAANKVNGITPGIYKYNPKTHMLKQLAAGNKMDELQRAALGQSSIGQSAATFIITGVYKRTSAKYGNRAKWYVHMEVGHASQNVYLQATALNLGTVVIGAFSDGAVKKIVGMPTEETPLCLMPIGKR